MPNEEEYDTSGVSGEESINVISNNLSEYLYPKVNTISNDDGSGGVDFTEDEIRNYSLDVNNHGEINISTTKKLIKYLKSFVKKSTNAIYNNLRNEFDGEFDVLNDKYDYIENYVENDLSDSLRTYIDDEFASIDEILDDKANISHTHNISDINLLQNNFTTLTNNINKKANSSDLVNHSNNKNNPHNVTLQQLNATWSEVQTNDERIKLYVNIGLKIGWLRIQGYFTGINLNNLGLVYTIPQEYRPITDFNLSISNEYITAIYINAFDGGVRINTPRKNGNFYGDALYLIK